MRVAVIVNTGGGGAKAPGAESTAARIAGALREQGIEAETTAVAPEGLADALAGAARRGVDAIVAAGGDGTIGAAAEAAVRARVALGVIPLGTLNHFARDAGIPLDLEQAVAVVAAGRRRSVDVAELNGRIFVNTSAVGLYPMMVRDREAQQRRLGRSKRLAMLVASLRALRHFRRHRLALRVAGAQAPLITPLLFVGNNLYETRLLGLGSRARLDGGELCLYALLARTRRQLLGLALRALFGRLDQQRDFVSLRGVREAEIAAATPSLAVAIDGETRRFETPLRYRLLPGALTLLAP